MSSHPTLDGALELRPAADAVQNAIAAGAFARKEYLLQMPATLMGQVIVEFPGFRANSTCRAAFGTSPTAKEAWIRAR